MQVGGMKVEEGHKFLVKCSIIQGEYRGVPEARRSVNILNTIIRSATDVSLRKEGDEGS